MFSLVYLLHTPKRNLLPVTTFQVTNWGLESWRGFARGHMWTPKHLKQCSSSAIQKMPSHPPTIQPLTKSHSQSDHDSDTWQVSPRLGPVGFDRRKASTDPWGNPELIIFSVVTDLSQSKLNPQRKKYFYRKRMFKRETENWWLRKGKVMTRGCKSWL